MTVSRRPVPWLPVLLLAVLAGLLGMHVFATGHGHGSSVVRVGAHHPDRHDGGAHPPAVAVSHPMALDGPGNAGCGGGCVNVDGHAGTCAGVSCTPAPAQHAPALGPPSENLLPTLLRAPALRRVPDSSHVPQGPSVVELGISRT